MYALDYGEVAEPILTPPPRDAAVKKLGVSRSTLYRMLKEDDDLREALRVARSDSLAEGTSTLQMATYEAASALRSMALNTEINDHVRLGACRAILEYAYRTRENEEIAAEIASLKR